MKQNSNQKSLLIAVGLSLLFHTSAVSFVLPQLPIFKSIFHPTGDQFVTKPGSVTFELVEQDIVDPVETPSRTPLIDSANQRAKGPEIINKKAGLPHMEGTSEAKTMKQKSQPSLETKPVTPSNYFVDEPSFFFQKMQGQSTNNLRDRLFKNMAPPEVEELGDPQLATQQNVLVPYLRQVKKKIFDRWYDLVEHQNSAFLGSRVVVTFKIRPDGSVNDVQIISAEGTELYREFCLTAVKRASPFGPLPIKIPAFLKQNSLSIQFTFCYE